MLEGILTEERVARLNDEGSIEDRWPVLLFTGNGRSTVEGTRVLHEILDGIFELKEPFALITDMRNMEIPGHDVRKLLGAYQGERKDEFTRYMIADAHVIGNKLIRGLVTVINWISPPSHPQGFFKTMEEAEQWCEVQLGKAGIGDG